MERPGSAGRDAAGRRVDERQTGVELGTGEAHDVFGAGVGAGLGVDLVAQYLGAVLAQGGHTRAGDARAPRFLGMFGTRPRHGEGVLGSRLHLGSNAGLLDISQLAGNSGSRRLFETGRGPQHRVSPVTKLKTQHLPMTQSLKKLNHIVKQQGI